MKKAFTLIELLIVVAIIAILAAIAVPNFLEAQTRAKISHEYSNMRTARVCMESYRVDNSAYPPDSSDEDYSFAKTTTPIAYCASIPKAVFPEWRVGTGSGSATPGTPGARPDFKFLYWSNGTGTTAQRQLIAATGYFITGAGPDQTRISGLGHTNFWDTSNPPNVRFLMPTDENSAGIALIERLYDPTNGTISGGDVVASYLGMHNTQ